MTRDQIVAEARRYVALETKWRHIGRSEQACDCIGLVLLVGWSFGLPFKDAKENYRRQPEGEKFVDLIRKQTVLTEPPLKPGMIVVLRESTLPCHVGIIAERHGHLRLIHSTAERGKVWEEDWNRHWQSRYRCALDFPGVED